MFTNIDTKTGIRYGVCHQAEVLQAWADSSEPVYTIDPDNDFDYDDIDPVCFRYEDDGYTCEQFYDGTDIFIMESPYFTLCQLCSPCAPGAGYIMDEGTNMAYCFGHDWFDSGKAPYHVYEVGTGKEVLPE